MKKARRTQKEIFRLFDQCFGADETAEDFQRAMRCCESFPEEVYALFYEGDGRFHSVQAPVENGAMCFVTVQTRELAEACIAAMDDELALGCIPLRMSIEQVSNEVRKSDSLDAILLVGDPDRLIIQYVR